MNIKRVFHPEQVMGTRGDPVMCDMYKKLLGQTKRCPEDDEEIAPGKIAYGWSFPGVLEPLLKDQHGKEFHLIMKLYREQTRKIYYIGDDFTRALGSVDRNIPLDLLPSRFFAYVAFADEVIRDEADWIEGAYVYIGPPYAVGISINGVSPDKRFVWIGYQCKNGQIGALSFDPTGEKVMDTLRRLHHERPTVDYDVRSDGTYTATETSLDTVEKREHVYRTIINAVLYIHSQDPDLTHLKPEQQLSLSQRKKHKESITNCTVPLTLVSWNYKKKPSYNVDSTWIDTFLRIQRCGPGLTQCKFVWVKEHERHYNKGENDHGKNSNVLTAGAADSDSEHHAVP